MKKSLSIFFTVLISSTNLLADQLALNLAQPTPVPVQEVPGTPAPVEHDAICAVRTLSSYALSLVDNLEILTRLHSEVSQHQIEVILRPQDVVSGKLSPYEGSLGLHLYESYSKDLFSADGAQALGFSLYTNGLDNMMFSKCKINFQLTINLRGMANAKAFSTSNRSVIELVGVWQTGLEAIPNTGVRAVSSDYGTMVSTVTNAKKSVRRRRRL